MDAQSYHFGSKDINSPECATLFTQRLTQPGGWFWHRIGGSDFDTVARQRSIRKPQTLSKVLGRLESLARQDRSRVRNLNGFFDLDSRSFEDTFQEYISILDESYKRAEGFTYGGKQLIDRFNGAGTSRGFQASYAANVVQTKDHLSYEFIEAIYPFFETLENWLAGQKVLIVSPFSKSIEHQFANKEKLFREYKYPEFELETYNTPITYNNSEDVREGNLSSATSNWVTELDHMKREINGRNFDIALLSCGSYAGPLGVDIASRGKKAIYIGGVLNILFNIFGQRYATDYVRAILNPEATIDALETTEILARAGGKSVPNEALRAYLR
jgi:hypothetical protein